MPSVLKTLLAGWLLLGSLLPAQAQQELSELAPPPAQPKLSTAFAPGKLITPPRVELPAQVVDGLLLVEAEVDGRRGAFFLDSGAPGLLLNQREFAPPPPGEAAPPALGSRGVNGSMMGFSRYLVRHFNCQGIMLDSQQVATFDMASLQRRLGVAKLLGIIGYEVLRAYAVTLDYRAGRVLLQLGAAGVASAAGVRVPFRLRGHLPVVAATIEGRPYQLGIDCGAQTNLLDPAAAGALARKLRHREQVTLRGADAAGSTAGMATVPRLTLADGKLTFRRQATTFADISDLRRLPGPVPLEGLLGYPLLSQYRTTIDYVNQQLLFERW